MRMWRNWQTRRFQVPVGDHAGSSPVIRTIIADEKAARQKNHEKQCVFMVFCCLSGKNERF